MCADDTQVYGFCRPIAVTALTVNITDCVEAATSLMRSQQASTKSRQDEVPVMRDRSATTSATDVAAADRRLLYHSSPVCSRPTHLRRLRPVDADTRPNYTVSRCFIAVRQLRQIRRSVQSATRQMLMVALVHSRLDYGNGVLVGLAAYLTRRLQSVLNAAARLI